MTDDPYRRTGRTTRMLEEAIRLWHSGQSVRIMVANTYEIQRMERQIYELAYGARSVVQMLNSTNDPRIIFTPIDDRYFHLETMRYEGCNHHILIDHHALDTYHRRPPLPPISRDLNTLHRLTSEALAEHPIKETVLTDYTGFPTHTQQDTRNFVNCLTRKIADAFDKPDFVVREENRYLRQQVDHLTKHLEHLSNITAVSTVVIPYQESQ